MHNQAFVVGPMQACAVLTAELKAQQLMQVVQPVCVKGPRTILLLLVCSWNTFLFLMMQIGEHISFKPVFHLILLCFSYQGKTHLHIFKLKMYTLGFCWDKSS